MAARRSMTPRESSKTTNPSDWNVRRPHPTTRVLFCRIAAGFAGVVLHDRHGMYPCSCPGYTIIKHVCLGPSSRWAQHLRMARARVHARAHRRLFCEPVIEPDQSSMASRLTTNFLVQANMCVPLLPQTTALERVGKERGGGRRRGRKQPQLRWRASNHPSSDQGLATCLHRQPRRRRGRHVGTRDRSFLRAVGAYPHLCVLKKKLEEDPVHI